MTEVLILGSFHFLEYDYDYYSSFEQNHIQKLVDNIACFNPEVIAVEAPTRSQRDINNCYDKLNVDDFNSPDIMKTQSLAIYQYLIKNYL